MVAGHQYCTQRGRSLLGTQMEDKEDFPENKLRDFIQGTDKAKWRFVNNHNIKYFTKDEIKRITGNYSISLGNGAFGKVYKGALGDNRAVAVKIYKRMDSEEAFAKEVIVHSQINHKNVVRLIGCCIEKNAPMMVFEYASNGTLGDNLHGSNTLISLDTRLSIAIQCAEALWCMHSMYNPVLHCDIKPSNILLDENFHAKISDFGISRLLAGDNTQHTTNVMGSFGYMDPAFYQEGRLTTKSDVYSLGVVLLELITGKKAIDGEFNLVKSFTQASAKGKGVRKLFDANIADDSNMKILEGIGKLAKDCLEEDIDKRPEMNDVAGRLRELRTTLRQGQPKTGWQFFSGTQTTLKVERQHDTSNIGSSSVLYKMKSLGLGTFSSVSKFEKNGGLIRHDVINLTLFSKKELKKITRGFTTIVGKGIFGQVYMGIRHDHTRVAVKRSIEVNGSQTEELINGILVQSRLIHKNIIKLIGCCLELEIAMMVYEFASNGSLHDILHGNSNHKLPLPLDLRLDIAIGSAQGLAYIHSASGTMPHGSIKPANILMDGNFVPKVSDYGKTRLLDPEYTPFVDIDYTDPVYMRTGLLTRKSDVYSFGVVLLELITRKQVRYDGDFGVIEFTRVFRGEKSGRAMFDNEIAVEEDIAILEEIGRLAMKCLRYDVDERPEMREVEEQLMMLKRARGQGKGDGGITNDIDQQYVANATKLDEYLENERGTKHIG